MLKYIFLVVFIILGSFISLIFISKVFALADQRIDSYVSDLGNPIIRLHDVEFGNLCYVLDSSISCVKF